LLVAPVTTAKATQRQVYLPAGRWLNYNDKRTVYEGQQTITAAAALNELPLFVKEGAILPRGDIVKLNNNWDKDWKAKLRIEVFPSAKEASEFTYFTGKEQQEIKATPGAEGETVQFGDLAVGGTLEVYCEKPSRVTKNGTRLREGSGYQYDAAAKRLTVSFDGATTVVIKGAPSLFATATLR
jgi:alpha-glucosidase (family GH31 glycosyl hydrolase)